eukprot:3548821-Rhodomonas_salina.1
MESASGGREGVGYWRGGGGDERPALAPTMSETSETETVAGIRRFSKRINQVREEKIVGMQATATTPPVLCAAAMTTSSRLSSTVSCAVCGMMKELDARGYPVEAGSTVRARCGHHFCSECLLERIAGCFPQEYECEHAGCGEA